MASHLFNRPAPTLRLFPRLAAPLAAVLDHPIMFVTVVWLVAYVAIAFMA